MSAATAIARGIAPTCHRRRELAQRYAISARQYAEAVVTLAGIASTTRDFDELCQKIVEVRERVGTDGYPHIVDGTERRASCCNWA